MVQLNSQAGLKVVLGIIYLLIFTTLFNSNIKAEVRFSQISKSSVQFLLKDLRIKTGIKSLAIRNGLLARGEGSPQKPGSEFLREFVEKIINDRKNLFEISEFSGRSKLHFGATDEGTKDFHSDRVRFQVHLDFADLKGANRFSSKLAISSFSPALILFHEIDHKVSYDPSEPLAPNGVRPDYSSVHYVGVVERTNRIRSQLGLPKRMVVRPILRRYRGLVESFRSTIEIPFQKPDGSKVFLRFKP